MRTLIALALSAAAPLVVIGLLIGAVRRWGGGCVHSAASNSAARP